MTTDTDTARDQAIAQLESIQAMVARLEHAQKRCYDWEDCNDISVADLRECDCSNSEEYHDEEEARQRIDEDPLSVMVRASWTAPGEKFEATEYEILLCTGGPAVRIIGSLDEFGAPDHALLQYQDWGIPWTELFNPRDMQALISYASNFYFGE